MWPKAVHKIFPEKNHANIEEYRTDNCKSQSNIRGVANNWGGLKEESAEAIRVKIFGKRQAKSNKTSNSNRTIDKW